MMPYDTYRLYRVERANSPREAYHADRRAARLTSAMPGLWRAIAQVVRRPCPATADGVSPLAAPAACRDPMAG